MEKPISLALHGGAGTITKELMSKEKEMHYRDALSKALESGYKILTKGGTSLEAVEAAVVVLEDSPYFNAGKGSVFSNKGDHEMDASIMEGKSKNAGAVAGISGIKNPIQLARLVLEKSDHVLLSAEGAFEFAKDQSVPRMKKSYFYDQYRYDQWQEAMEKNIVQLDHSPLKENKFGTVGAVALDRRGNLAAATSTGGLTNKKYGRVGDSPIIGSGTYANNSTCAVSCTGDGEYFLRGVVAYDVSCLMEYKGLSLGKACEEVVYNRLVSIGGNGGLIAVDALGNVALPFNTDGMYRAAKTSSGIQTLDIYK